MALDVIVVGAGVGGLCLGAGLRRAGVAVRVFERAGSAVPADEAYRLRLDSHGRAALVRCLPPELSALVVATGDAEHEPSAMMFDHQLNPLVRTGKDPATAHQPASDVVTNRLTLRQVLLAGLGNEVETGRELVAVTDIGDRVCARFADGLVATAAVLVGADGADSVVRRQLVPDARLVDTGVCGIRGHLPLDAERCRALPVALTEGVPRILAPDGLTLVVGACRPARPPRQAAAELAPYARLDHVAAHLQWTLVGPPESFGTAAGALTAWSGPRLHRLAGDLTAGWNPILADVIRESDVDQTSAVTLRAALSVPAWPVGRISLLGDAAHACTPVGGAGATTALRDAALLVDALSTVNSGAVGLTAALAGYWDEMRRYGSEAAMRSLRGAEHLFRVYNPALD
jgi:2-polyprenyl-6-methoxyphenol hydroxylase-like FAD-dependent oxidoreductase